MEIKYIETTFKAEKELISEYIDTLTGRIDDFAEEQMMSGQLYRIEADGTVCGVCSIRKGWENDGNYITLFYVRENYLYLAQSIFCDIARKFNVTKSLVASCDELFLSITMDYHEKVEIQACFFDGTITHNVRAAEFSRECLKPLGVDDLSEYDTKGEQFFGPVTEQTLETSDNYYFKLERDNIVYGYGFIAPNQLQKGYWATGLIVVKEQRCHGAGRSIQMHLADFTREHGAIPIGGCWYYNNNSKKTFESSGRYTKTRYFNVTLSPVLLKKESVNIK